MQQAKLKQPVLAGHRGRFGKAGTEVVVLKSVTEDLGIMMAMNGISALYAVAIPKSELTAEEVETAEWLFDDDTGTFYDEMDALIAQAPEGHVVTTVDNTELELL